MLWIVMCLMTIFSGSTNELKGEPMAVWAQALSTKKETMASQQYTQPHNNSARRQKQRKKKYNKRRRDTPRERRTQNLSENEKGIYKIKPWTIDCLFVSLLFLGFCYPSISIRKVFFDFGLKSIIFFSWLQLVGFLRQRLTLASNSSSLHSVLSSYESVLSLLPCAIQLVQKKDTISALFFFYFFLFYLPSSSSARSIRKKCAYQMTKKCIKFSTASFVIDTRTGIERKGSIADFCPKK